MANHDYWVNFSNFSTYWGTSRQHQDNWQLWDCCFFYDPAIHGTPQAISEYSHQPCHFQRWWGIPWDTPMVFSKREPASKKSRVLFHESRYSQILHNIASSDNVMCFKCGLILVIPLSKMAFRQPFFAVFGALAIIVNLVFFLWHKRWRSLLDRIRKGGFKHGEFGAHGAPKPSQALAKLVDVQ